jgi:DNA-binding transcriptional ArsR family regulator
MNALHKSYADLLKAMGHPIRFCILEGLMGGARNVAAIADCVHAPQPTVSQHLNILKAARIICSERIGSHIQYAVCSSDARNVLSVLEKQGPFQRRIS